MERNGFPSPKVTEIESIMSPTSILDGKPFSRLKSSCSLPETCSTPRVLEPKGIGLGILDSLKDEKSDPLPRQDFPTLRLRSQLRIQIPPLPGDFRIKTRSLKVGVSSLSLSSSSSQSPAKQEMVKKVHALSAGEMELSEDYTCVISHGPNPKTTHIFDDCIVDDCHGSVVGFSDCGIGRVILADQFLGYPSDSFLSFCYTCKKNLGDGDDIYIYRGEKAFCSCECRQQEMLIEEGREKLESDDFYGTCY